MFSTKKSVPVFLGLGVGLICALAYGVGILQTWSAAVNDRLFLSRQATKDVVIVSIDDDSISSIGLFPWPRHFHAEIIKALSAAGAKAIGYDVSFPEKSTTDEDAALVSAVRQAGNVVLPVELKEVDSTSVSFNSKKVLAPIPELASAAQSVGYVNWQADQDGVVRRLRLNMTGSDDVELPSFSARLLRIAGLEDRLKEAPEYPHEGFIINFPDEPLRAFRVIRAMDILSGTFDKRQIQGKIVLVGSTAPDLHDEYLVSTSHGQPMPGVEIHASALDTLIGRHWLRIVNPALVGLLIALIGLLVGFLASYFRTRYGLPLVLLVFVGFVFAGFSLIDHGWLIDLIWPTLALFFSFAVVTLERRINSDQQRRALKTAFSRYVSSSVVESILKDPAKLKLGGERRRMTVMFSDIRGFTTISEGMGPEKLVHVLNIYLNRMTNIVFEHQGVLDKYIGDAVMAFWNAPLDQPNHALLAVKTTLDMRDALDDMNKSKAFGDLELHIGLGVNTGEMVVGNVGGDARFDYTVIGDNVNLGSRLEGLTKEYGISIIVAESTKNELGDKILTRRLDKVAVKGKKEPVVIYEAMDTMEGSTRERKQLAKDFEAALELYFQQKFTEAITACEAILAHEPNDGPSKTLKERAEHFVKNPPPEGWVGTWVYTKK